MNPVIENLMKGLQANFTQGQVSWKAQTKPKDGKILAVAYIDARDVMRRLDEVVGCDRWKAVYNQIGDRSFECHLSIKFGDEWISKCDVGGTSDQPEEDNRVKAGYSDALKRAAVHWGIGRSIYQLPLQYVPANGNYLAQEPKLPKWYLDGFQAPPDGTKPEPAPKTEPKVEPVVKITQEQMSKIEKFIDIAKVDVEAFLKHYKVESVGQMDFDTANKALAKLKERADKAIAEAAKEPK